MCPRKEFPLAYVTRMIQSLKKIHRLPIIKVSLTECLKALSGVRIKSQHSIDVLIAHKAQMCDIIHKWLFVYTALSGEKSTAFKLLNV